MKNIDEILKQYFEGETSLEEEKQLRVYFQRPDIDDQYKIYAPMFNFFSEESVETVIQQKKKNVPLYKWASIAASILFIIGVWSLSQISVERNTKSLVYIDGKRIVDRGTIDSEALISIQSISDIDEDIIDSQIGILDSFTD